MRSSAIVAVCDDDDDVLLTRAQQDLSFLSLTLTKNYHQQF